MSGKRVYFLISVKATGQGQKMFYNAHVRIFPLYFSGSGILRGGGFAQHGTALM